MTKHDAVRAWLLTCPQIQRMGFNFGAEEDGSTAMIPYDYLLTEYIDGSQQRRYAFELIRFHDVKEDPGGSLNAADQAEMDKLTEWVQAQEKAGNYPQFPQGCTVQKVQLLDGQESMVAERLETMAKYMIPFGIDYLKE